MRILRESNLTILDKETLRKNLLDAMKTRGTRFYFENFFTPPAESDSTAELLNNYFQVLGFHVEDEKISFPKEGFSEEFPIKPFVGCTEGYIEWYDDFRFPDTPVFRDVYMKDGYCRKFAKLTWEGSEGKDES